MARLVRLDDFRRRRGLVHFTRQELNQLLQVYSRRVASGEWRDYAIQHDTSRARFMAFRHRLEGPAFTIVKFAPDATGHSLYQVTAGGRLIVRSTTLGDVLGVFKRRLTLVSSGA
ncbi:MAG TPA: DUF2794 domain-containing protein [Alphaproteobacteria bacterium]|nr:DUF2794 domain-containing protein [Alphaproteobacteria bacterium]